MPFDPPKVNNVPPDTEVPLLKAILAALSGVAAGGSGVIIVNGTAVAYDAQVFTYYDSGATNIQTITYKTGGSGGTTVGVQTFAYIQNAVTTANASIQAIVTTSS